MLYLVVCTEGENSEPAFIEELDRISRGQSINEDGVDVSVVTISLKGIHGHTKIIEAANAALDFDSQKKTDGPLSDFSCEDDSLEKWLICDYYYMEKHGVDLGDFRKKVAEAGYELVLNRPNFEFFVLAVLTDVDSASNEQPSNYEIAINNAVDSVNAANRINKGFYDGMRIPKYSKKHHAVPLFFGKLLDYSPELIDKFCTLKFDPSLDRFSEMSRIIKRIRELRGD
jgi:hypothetical protein